MARKMNQYSSLYMDHENDLETKNMKRKAVKKLREIEALKLKKIKTPEELKKIQDEDIWKAIAEPAENPLMDTPVIQLERKERQMERSKQKEESRKMRQLREKHKDEMAKKNKTISAKEKIIDKKDRVIEEMNIRNINLLEENAKLLKQLEDMKAKDVSLDEKLKKEFLECYTIHKSYKKAYYVMMRKYHPDKKKGITTKMAEECSKILNNLKNEYMCD